MEIQHLRAKGLLTKDLLRDLERIREIAVERLERDKFLPLERVAGGRSVDQALFLGPNAPQLAGALPVKRQDVDVDPEATIKRTIEIRDRLVQSIRQASLFQERLIQLSAGPGGELDAIRAIAKLREESALREFQITQDRGRLNEQLNAAEQERIISTLELRKRELDDYRQQAGQVFDALTARGSGELRDFLQGQLKILERQLFVNASTGIFQQFGSTLGRGGHEAGGGVGFLALQTLRAAAGVATGDGVGGELGFPDVA